MRKLPFLFLVLGVIFLTSCAAPESGQETPESPESPSNAECATDADCGIGGCSGQICAQKEIASSIITTCEYREEYGCLELSNCGCFKGGCEWAQTPAYNECLEKIK